MTKKGETEGGTFPISYNLSMTSVTSFSPIEGISARVLILGSMPGLASLKANQYYAHPQNAFWKILGTITSCPATASYEMRVEALKQSGIALWDVLESCIRPGSLDADIDMNSAQANNIAALLQRQPEIKTICFNGSAAEKIFNKRILPTLENTCLKYVRLPSTSPAHAGMSLADKTKIWREAIEA